MQKIEFYQDHLDRVSRSFAFCIQKLTSPFREWTSLSYLLCRVLDTIEDSPWQNSPLKDDQYQTFYLFLSNPPSTQNALNWAQGFPSLLPEGEKILLRDTFYLFKDLHELPEIVRQVILVTTEKMYRGMKFYSDRSQGGPLRLLDLTDVNRYCYFVAGTVGELMSQLYLIYQPEFKPQENFRTNGLHLGLFLQKINLLKDQRSDEDEGRYLVPNRRVLLSSLKRNALGSLDYLLSLPMDERGYRTFCAWSLFLGAASLPWIAQSFECRDNSRIPRDITQELLLVIENIILDNLALKSAFKNYTSMIFDKDLTENHAILPDVNKLSIHSINSEKIKDFNQFDELTGRTLNSAQMLELQFK